MAVGFRFNDVGLVFLNRPTDGDELITNVSLITSEETHEPPEDTFEDDMHIVDQDRLKSDKNEDGVQSIRRV